MTLLMRAAVLHGTGDLRVEKDIAVPIPARGQVLVKMAYSGLCRSQLMEFRGGRGEDRFLPHLLGHEGSGTVMETGAGVTKVKSGDSVILGWIKGEGLEGGGVRYSKDGRVINAGPVTTLNDYAVVSENRCVKMPEGLSMEVATLFGCALPTGAGIVLNELNPTEGATIAIFGMGGIGISALLAAGLFKFERVIAVDVESDKLALARNLGATHAVDASREDPATAILRLTGGKGTDFAVEAAGTTRSIEQAFESVRPSGGLCVFASHPPQGEKIRLDPHALISGRQIRGSWGGASRPDRDVPRLASLYSRRRASFESLLSRGYGLEDVHRALTDLENRKIVRAIISIGADAGVAGPRAGGRG